MARRTKEGLLREILFTSRAMQNAADALDEAVGEHLGLNRTDLLCLDTLDRMGKLTAGELAREARLTTGAVTRVVDRLVEAAYARRIPDPADRRRVTIERTDKARRDAGDAYGPIVEHVMRSGPQFSHEQLVGILRFLELGCELNARRAAEIREGA